MQLNTTGFTPPVPMGGFLDPQKIVDSLGILPGMRAADFGSGAGHFTILLAKAVGETGVVTAVDILSSALETLKAKAKIDNLNNIETVRSNLEMPGGSGLANDSEDLVLLANTLFQNPNKELIIEEARRVLKPEGSLVVIEWRKGAGGFGPPDNLRTDPEEMHRIIGEKGFEFADAIDTGSFHYGMLFKKL